MITMHVVRQSQTDRQTDERTSLQYSATIRSIWTHRALKRFN